MSLVMSTNPASPYVAGEQHPNQRNHAAFEFKQADPDRTGGGYPRWRSYELRPETPGREKEDVYVSVHRLCAIAWLFEDGRTAADILRSDDFLGSDVHHELGMPSANIEESLSLREHGEHAEITQAQQRAWAEDRRREVEKVEEQPLGTSSCDLCGTEVDTLAECEAWPGEKRCPECARETANGEVIHL